MRRRSIISALVAGIALVVSPAALAGIEGPCEVTVAAVDVRDRGTGLAARRSPSTRRRARQSR